MEIGTVIQLLGLVVAVMLVQVLINLASGVQDLYSKLLAGHVIYTWSRQQAQACDTTFDTTNPTGAYIKVKDRYGRERIVAADSAAATEPEEEEPGEENEVDDSYWKRMLKGV